MFIFQHVHICKYGAVTRMGKTAASLAQMQAVAPIHTSSHCILRNHTLRGKKWFFTPCLDEAVIFIYFIKSQPVTTF